MVLPRLWDVTIYLPSSLYCHNFRLRLRPADYCCSCCCRCCECCDLRKSVCVAAGWQFLIGGAFGGAYTALTVFLLDSPQELSLETSPLFVSLLIYLLCYWWLYFLSGIVGCCAAADTQGILTYERRVINMCRGYLGLTILCALGHLNLVGLDRSLWKDPLSTTNIFVTFLPCLWDWYIVYLAWSLLRKLQEQRKGLFRGKPVMSNQRKPEQIAELHSAHRLALTPPPGQIILPLAHHRQPSSPAEVPAAPSAGQRWGLAAGRRPSAEAPVGSGAGAVGGGLAGGGGSFADWAESSADGGRITPSSTPKTRHRTAQRGPSEAGSSVWDVRDSSAGASHSSAYASATEQLDGGGDSDGGGGAYLSAGGSARDGAAEPPPLSLPLPPVAVPPPPPLRNGPPSVRSDASGDGGGGGSAAREHSSAVASAFNDVLAAIEEEDLPGSHRLRPPQRTITPASLHSYGERRSPSPPRQRPHRPAPAWHFPYLRQHTHGELDHASSHSSRNLAVASAAPSYGPSLHGAPLAPDGRSSLPGADRMTAASARGGSGGGGKPGGGGCAVFELRMQPLASAHACQAPGAPGSREDPSVMLAGPGPGQYPRPQHPPLPSMEPVVLSVPATAMYGTALFAPTPRGAPTPRPAPPWLSAAGSGAAGGGAGETRAVGAGVPQLARAPSLSRKAAFLRQVSLQRARAQQPQAAGRANIDRMSVQQQPRRVSLSENGSHPPSPTAHRISSPRGKARPFVAPWDAGGATASAATHDRSSHGRRRPAPIDVAHSPPASPSRADTAASASGAVHLARIRTRASHHDRGFGAGNGLETAGSGAGSGSGATGHGRRRDPAARSEAVLGGPVHPSPPRQDGYRQHRSYQLAQGGHTQEHHVPDSLSDGGEGHGSPRTHSYSHHSQASVAAADTAFHVHVREPRPLRQPRQPPANMVRGRQLTRSFTPPRSGEGSSATGWAPLPPLPPARSPWSAPARREGAWDASPGGHKVRGSSTPPPPPGQVASATSAASHGRPPPGPSGPAGQSRFAQRGSGTNFADWWGSGEGAAGGGKARAPHSDDGQVASRWQGWGGGAAGGGVRRPSPPARALVGSSGGSITGGSVTATTTAATSPSGGRAAAFAAMLRPLQLPSLATAAMEGAQAMYDKYYVPLTTRAGRQGSGAAAAAAVREDRGGRRLRGAAASDPGDGGDGINGDSGGSGEAGGRREGALSRAPYVSLEIMPAEGGMR